MKKIRFGTAGFGDPKINIPSSSKNPTGDAVIGVKNLGLEALEIEFVRSVYLKNTLEEKLLQIKNNALEKKVNLSIHAPYYINLNAKEEQKIINSQRYILDSLNVGQKIGAKIIVCHIGYFLKEEPKKVLENISHQIEIIKSNFKGDVKLGIELMGKKTQVGSLQDIFYFMERHPNFVRPVIDFAHQHARENGFFKQKKNINNFFNDLRSYPEIFEDLHMHMSGIAYSEKGEKHHLIFREADLPYKEILINLKDNKTNGTLICESPDIVKDALFLKKIYEEL